MEDNNIRVDVWKTNGMWYTTLYLPDLEFDRDLSLDEAFRKAFVSEFGSSGLEGMTISCLDPRHVNARPIQIIL